MSDALADLGLDLGTDTVATAEVAATETPVVAADAAAGEAATKREEVAIADLEFGFVDLIPAQKRGGASGSKYEFHKLVAPVAKEDGTGFKYATFTVKPENAADFDADKLKRSVQSATTAENREAKKEGRVDRYITRQAIVGGEFVGVTVFRVDATLDAEADKGE